MSKLYALLQNWHFTSILSPSLIIESISFLLMVDNALATRSLEQSHTNAAGISSVIVRSKSPRISFKISSGVMPRSNIMVTESISAIRFSNLSIISSLVKGISWIINPPASCTVLSLFISTPSPTEDGTCSLVAK